jgi:hypothetical protein
MGRNFDYPMPQEGRMAKQQLARIAMDAAKLHNALQDDDDLPAWVLLKINTSEDRLHMASDYMRYKVAPGLNAYQGVADITAYGAAEGDPSADDKKDSLVRIGTSAGIGTAVGAAWAAYSGKNAKMGAVYGALAGAAVGVARNLAMGKPAIGYGADDRGVDPTLQPFDPSELSDEDYEVWERDQHLRALTIATLVPTGAVVGYFVAKRYATPENVPWYAALGGCVGFMAHAAAAIYRKQKWLREKYPEGPRK